MLIYWLITQALSPSTHCSLFSTTNTEVYQSVRLRLSIQRWTVLSQMAMNEDVAMPAFFYCLLNVYCLLCHPVRDIVYFFPFSSSPDTGWVGGFWPIFARPSCCEKTSQLSEAANLTLVLFEWAKWWKWGWLWKSPVDVITPSSELRIIVRTHDGEHLVGTDSPVEMEAWNQFSQ